VDRLACVSLPAFPLQILFCRHPEWRGAPAAVVEEDRPQSQVVWVNGHARRAGVLPGLRYAAALALAPTLRAGAVSSSQVIQERDRLTARLRRFTPDVEPAAEYGIFWIGLRGLERLYPSPARWADTIRADLREAGFGATVVIGFTRFGTYAVAQVSEGTRIFHDPAHEQTVALDVPLARLAIAPAVRESLGKLGVTTVSALVRLPDVGLLERFGTDAYRLHQMAAGEQRTALRPSVEPNPVRRRLALDAPEPDLARCLFVFKHLLDPMLATLAARGEALAALEVRVKLDGRGWQVERVRPAAPTLDPVQVLELVRLRLETALRPPTPPAGQPSSGGITDVVLEADGLPAAPEQLQFFSVHPRRDLAAGNRALARLRAEFGEHAVVRARLRDGHLPEARIVWEPMVALAMPQPAAVLRRALVRRLFVRPTPLAATPPHPRNDGWLILGTTYGAVVDLLGPHIVSGGWWVREVDRAYHFAQTRRGDLLWVYHDRLRRRWFLHGLVE